MLQVHELERNCRTLETEAQNLRVQTQELEEELSEAENSRLRLEVTLQALKAQFEREISTAEEKGEEKRRALSKQVEREQRGATGAIFITLRLSQVQFPFKSKVRELEIQLEEERSQRSQAMSSRKQLDAELQESEAQLETASRGKEEAMKQLRRLQVCRRSHTSSLYPPNGIFTNNQTTPQGQMKEILRELDDTKLSREEIIAQSKDSEKKIQTLEAEVLHLSEVCAEADGPNPADPVLTVAPRLCRSSLCPRGRRDRLSRRGTSWPTRWSTAARGSTYRSTTFKTACARGSLTIARCQDGAVGREEEVRCTRQPAGGGAGGGAEQLRADVGEATEERSAGTTAAMANARSDGRADAAVTVAGSVVQMETLAVQLQGERTLAQKAEAARDQLEKQNKELKTRLTDLEGVVRGKHKLSVAALEAKIESMEEQLEQERQ